jgi:uncharacterized protein
MPGTGRAIYRQDGPEYSTFYAPGCLCVVARPEADDFAAALAGPAATSPFEDFAGRLAATIPSPARTTFEDFAGRPAGGQDRQIAEEPESLTGWAAWLQRHADQAGAAARRLLEEPFSPECLTLYMNNECSLRCVYCHTDPSPRPSARLELEAITAAGLLVAAGCRRKSIPFSIVFHGGGEPTLHRERVERAMARLEAIAAAQDVVPFRYVATNGVMSEAKARWLAGHFDLVGLSCDGPAEVQDRQRPDWNGRGTSTVVERTGRILREEGCRFHVRTTITAATLARQAEIAEYICRQFAPEEIHFEPVYAGGRTGAGGGLAAEQAGEFALHFLKAQAVARRYGLPLLTSGSRLSSIHGPYCHVFRHVVNLVPGGLATACFKITDAAQVRARGVAVGRFDAEAGRFEMDGAAIQAMRYRLGAVPPPCRACFNRYHCVRGCPDHCPLDGHAGPDAEGPAFRCRVQKALAYACVREAAEKLWAAGPRVKADGNRRSARVESDPIIRGTTLL